jgi:hypothetical protein
VGGGVYNLWKIRESARYQETKYAQNAGQTGGSEGEIEVGTEGLRFLASMLKFKIFGDQVWVKIGEERVRVVVVVVEVCLLSLFTFFEQNH